MKVYFDTKSVQRLGRIVLNEALLRNAGLHEGDAVDIFFDATTKGIIIQKAEPNPAVTLDTASSKGSEDDQYL